MKQTPRKKLLLYKGIAVLMPLLALCIIEIFLRIFHYGYNPDLFIEYPADKNYLILNPEASKKYFTDEAFAPAGNIEPFRKEKEQNTLRIFVLGESTTIGYPYFHNGSFHRWLQYRLMRSMPDRNFEIINLSLTAVNSYTVLGFAKELAGYEPDAVLIYTGHNEYYGTLGVGSVNSMGSNPFIVNLLLSLRELKLVQLMTRLYQKTAGLFGANQSNSGKTRMQFMVADQQIPYQSGLYRSGISQFRYNMDKALGLLNKMKVPVFISNLVSNEKDLKPFISMAADSVRFPGFKKNYASGLQAFKNKDLHSAFTYFKQADRIYNAHALCNFYLGQIACGLGDTAGAKAYFSRARDLDALRFRAPEEINEAIVQLCHKYPNTHLADARSAFEARSPGHITGHELILEHVHPNLSGYALLSDVFYEALKKEHIIAIDQEMSFARLQQSMPITKTDSLTGLYRIAILKNGWPFNEAQPPVNPQSVEEKFAYHIAHKNTSWQGAMDSLYRYYIEERDLSGARSILETLTLEHPAEAPFFEKTAMLCGEMEDYENAIYYFRRAFDLSPSFDMARYLFVIYFKLDRPAEAMPYLDYAINHNTWHLNLLPVKALATEIIRLQKQYAKDTTDTYVLNQIASRYSKMGNKEAASKYLEKVSAITSHAP